MVPVEPCFGGVIFATLTFHWRSIQMASAPGVKSRSSQSARAQDSPVSRRVELGSTLYRLLAGDEVDGSRSGGGVSQRAVDAARAAVAPARAKGC
jgi:hypothetical protein